MYKDISEQNNYDCVEARQPNAGWMLSNISDLHPGRNIEKNKMWNHQSGWLRYLLF